MCASVFFFHSLTWFDFDTGQISSLSKADCQFAYRDSIFKRDFKERAVILDVMATPAIRTAEVNSTKTMIERVQERFGMKPKRLIGDTAYGSAEILSWIVKEKEIEPHVPVWERGEREDGTFSRSDFAFDAASNILTCPGGKRLVQFRRHYSQERSGVTKADMRIYRASTKDCRACALKQQC